MPKKTKAEKPTISSVLSIDIGYRNLGVCVMDAEFKVSRLNLINLMGEETVCVNKTKGKKKKTPAGKARVVKTPTVDLKVVADNLHACLGEDVYHDVDCVIIEKQFTPGGGQQNNRANSISYMVLQYFVDEARYRDRPKSVVFVQPSARFKLRTLPVGITAIDRGRLKVKKDRKQYSVELSRKYFTDCPEAYAFTCLEYLNTLRKEKKEDDVCDAYLSARQYVERIKK